MDEYVDHACDAQSPCWTAYPVPEDSKYIDLYFYVHDLWGPEEKSSGGASGLQGHALFTIRSLAMGHRIEDTLARQLPLYACCY